MTDDIQKTSNVIYSRFLLPVKQSCQPVPSRWLLSQPTKSRSPVQKILTLTLHHLMVIIILLCNFCHAVLCISAAYAVTQCLSIHPSVTFVDHVKTNKHIFEIFSPSGSHTILVISYQKGWRYFNETPLMEALNAGGVGKNAILDEYLALLYTGLQWYQPYELRSVKNKAATNGAKRWALTAASVVRCSHKRTMKCLWQARCYTLETKGGQTPLGHNPCFLLP